MKNTVSGGFAVVQPDSQLSINAVEGFPLEDFSADVGFTDTFADMRRTMNDANFLFFSGHPQPDW